MAAAILLLNSVSMGLGQQTGSIRGTVYDADFEVPLPNGKVEIIETEQSVVTGRLGEYALLDVAPGTYTLKFSKPGFTSEVRLEISVLPGELTDVEVSLEGDLTDLEPFVVEENILSLIHI